MSSTNASPFERNFNLFIYGPDRGECSRLDCEHHGPRGVTVAFVYDLYGCMAV